LDTDTILAAPMPAMQSSRVTVADLESLGQDVEETLDRVKDVVFQPAGAKSPPRYGTMQLAAMCGISHDTLMRRLIKASELGLPEGNKSPTNRKLSFSLEETLTWVRRERKGGFRPDGYPGAVIATGNFKGGVGKTTVTMSVAQGLSLKGYKVLCIDLDPQGSLTSLFGLTPTAMEEGETFFPLTVPLADPRHRSTLDESIHKTYWANVDLVPGSAALFSGEFYLPVRQMSAQDNEPNFRFNEVLERALKGRIRDEYDYIIIDTPPALSYITMNAFWAADAILMPLPPEGMDFASSAQFWTMFAELASSATRQGEELKSFGWVGVVPSKVDSKPHSQSVLKWMRAAYRGYLTSAELPTTDAAKVASMRLQTVYDIERYVGSHKTYARARLAFDKLTDEIDHLTHTNVWTNAGQGSL
jgi:chromosome partitioning protein